MIDPVTGSALILGGSSVLGSILNSYSQSSANEQQRKMFEKSLEFQKYQYEDQKSYNSAQAQAARLRAAGINPVLNGVDGGSISAVSSPAAPSQGAVDYSGIMNGASEMANSMTQGSLADSTKDLQDSQAALNYEKGISELWYRSPTLKGLQQTAKKLGFDAEQSRIMTNLQKETFAGQVQSMNYDVRMKELMIEAQYLQNAYKEITNGFLPTQIWAQVQNTLADTKYKLEHNKIDWAQAHAAVTSAAAQMKQAMKVNGMFMTDQQQKEWYDASYDYLLQQYDESVSKEFNNHFIPGVWGSGVATDYPSDDFYEHFIKYKHDKRHNKRW